MHIHSATSITIRQEQAGQFRRPEDGRQPYAHVNDMRIESANAQKPSSIFVNRQKATTIKKEPSQADGPTLFDHDAGVQFTLERIQKTKTNDISEERYDVTDKRKTPPKPKTSIIEDWA
jgi:hypothetical protein